MGFFKKHRAILLGLAISATAPVSLRAFHVIMLIVTLWLCHVTARATSSGHLSLLRGGTSCVVLSLALGIFLVLIAAHLHRVTMHSFVGVVLLLLAQWIGRPTPSTAPASPPK